MPGRRPRRITHHPVAMRVLAGVGDASLGEWAEAGERAWHVRRRLSAAEEALVGPALDRRGTDEYERRLAAAMADTADPVRLSRFAEYERRPR